MRSLPQDLVESSAIAAECREATSRVLDKLRVEGYRLHAGDEKLVEIIESGLRRIIHAATNAAQASDITAEEQLGIATFHQEMLARRLRRHLGNVVVGPEPLLCPPKPSRIRETASGIYHRQGMSPLRRAGALAGMAVSYVHKGSGRAMDRYNDIADLVEAKADEMTEPAARRLLGWMTPLSHLIDRLDSNYGHLLPSRRQPPLPLIPVRDEPSQLESRYLSSIVYRHCEKHAIDLVSHRSGTIVEGGIDNASIPLKLVYQYRPKIGARILPADDVRPHLASATVPAGPGLEVSTAGAVRSQIDTVRNIVY